MAVAAIDSVIGHVMFMAELYGLFPRDKGLRIVGRAVELGYQPKKRSHEKDRAENTHSRDGVRAGVEDLRHRLPNSIS